jgi:hypothetical protein
VHLEALCGKRADRRQMNLRVEDPLHATEKQANAASALADRGRERREAGSTGGCARSNLDEASQLARQREPSRGAHQRRECAQTSRIGESFKHEPPDRAIAKGPPKSTLDLRPYALDQPVVARPRRTGGDARHAAKTGIEVGHHLGRERPVGVEGLVNQHYPPTWRIRLLRPQRVGQAALETEPAVDTVLDHGLLRRSVLVEDHQIPPTNTLGLHDPAGSNRCFTRRISSIAGPS